MKFKQGQIIQTQSIPLAGWYLRWIPWVISGFVCVGYLSGVLSTQHLTLVSLLLLTGTYGAWLVIYHIGVRRFAVRSHPCWVLALFCLACASQFIPLPGTNVYWLPELPLITTGLMTTIKPRPLGLLAAGALCLSSYLAVRRIVPDWDVSGQVTVPLVFLSIYGYGAIIRELAVAHTALEGSNAKLAAAHTRLQEYSAQVEELSVIRERNRIAREIHDTLGHALTLLSVQLETATQLEVRGDPRLHEELLQARQVAKACLTEVRHSVEALRPDEASAGSLQEQLRKLVAEFETTCRETQITLDLEEATHPLNPDLCLTLYRCAQEALTNIRKHASIGLVVAGDVAYNDVHLHLGESNAHTRREWIAALDTIEALHPRAVIAGHKRPGNDDRPRIIDETRQYIRAFDRLAETTTARGLYDQMLSLYPDRINPGILWASARAVKG